MNKFYIKELCVPKNNFKEFFLDDKKQSDPDNFSLLHPLSKVNIFVGPNNSRKSRFLRLLSALVNYSFKTDDSMHSEFLKIPQDFLESVKQIFQKYSIENYGEINQRFAQFQSQDAFVVDPYIVSENEYQNKLRQYFEHLDSLSGTPQVAGRGITPEEHQQLQSELKQLVSTYTTRIDDAGLSSGIKYSFKRVYIPTLRGFRQFSELGGNINPYHSKTQTDYFNGLPSDVMSAPTIFTGYDLYQKLLDLANGNPAKRDLKKTFQNFLSEKFYKGLPVELTSRNDTNLVHIIVGNEEEREVQNIGDGIQQLVLLFFAMFENLGEKAIFFIEEPELFMHPGMQRQFLETIYSDTRFAGFQFFFTTHSNHFLDMTLDYNDISIFRCEKIISDPTSGANHTHIFNVDSPDESVLSSLGVRNSSVFLSNSTIWVEGVSDRIYYRHYLKLYQDKLDHEDPQHRNKRFQEDLHFSFVEYGGNNITHWSFLDDEGTNVDRLCAKLLLIADGDTKNEKLERKKKLLEKLGENRFVDLGKWDRRESENLLTKEVLLKVVTEYEKDNGDINERFTEQSYHDKYLGKFIEDKILKGNKHRRGSYKNEWGSINGKEDFAKKAIKHIENFDDLSDPAKELSQQIYEFIKRNNPE